MGIKIALDISWEIFSLWYVANVKLLLFWLFNRWNSAVESFSKFSAVGGGQCSLQCNCIGQYFVVWPWYLTLYYCWCRWLCWSECLHLQMQQCSVRKYGMYCHVWSYSLQLCCSMPWFVTANHTLLECMGGCVNDWTWTVKKLRVMLILQHC